MHVGMTYMFSADIADSEDKEYAVVLFCKANQVGVTYSRWLSTNGKQTMYPKNENYAAAWMKNKRMPANVNESKTKWKKLSCQVYTYAGTFLLSFSNIIWNI